jgi:predicted HTH transcriptional regulator
MEALILSEIIAAGEAADLEFKAAQGRDGKGELPNNFWETYSAMANTEGGEIYLGIEELSAGKFRVKGVADVARLKKSLWDTLHSNTKVSRNILTEAAAQEVLVDGLPVLRVAIPRARRQDRPVYLHGNPLGNTYLRRHDGDYKASEETVRRMMAESVEDSRDDRILDDFTMDDLEKETISAYRNRFSAVKPDSPWIGLPSGDFLVKIGAVAKDPATGRLGLRAAGLLMFGRSEGIQEAFPNYMVDYQERPDPEADARWVDRIVPDGTWSGNLYDFFHKAYRKLVSDLKIPFKLKDGARVEDTPVHEAVREALINAIIHADYTGRTSVLAVKRSDMFRFRNPGLMRVPVEQAVHGGESDCRNRTIQKMFRLVGFGDHAGSGIPKIYRNWKEQHWRVPRLYETFEREFTQLELRMISLLPAESVRLLDGLFGKRFRGLPELERIILVTAAAEDSVNHARIKEMVVDHPKDISAALARLVQNEMLIKQGETRGSTYALPGKRSAEATALPQDKEGNSPHLAGNSPHLAGNSPHLTTKLLEILAALGFSKMPSKLKPEIMRELILSLCADEALSIRTLSLILKRAPRALQERYLAPMLEEGSLKLKYPGIKNHPDQGYRKNNGE